MNGDSHTPLVVQSHPGIRERYFVSKNVCHGMLYDATAHAALGSLLPPRCSQSRVSPTQRASPREDMDSDAQLASEVPSDVEAVQQLRSDGSTVTASKTLIELHRVMSMYLSNNAGGKIFHDPFAACAALDPAAVADWEEVRMYRAKVRGFGTQWGCVSCPGSRTWITVKGHKEAFFRVLFQQQER